MTVSGVKSLSHKLARSRGSYVRIWNGLTEPAAAIVQPQERRRARLLASALIAIILLVGFALILLFVFQAELYLILGAFGLAGLLVAYGFTRTPYPMIGGGIALGVIAGVPYIAALIDPGRLFVLLFLLDSTLLSLLLFKMRTTGIVVIAALAAMFAFPFIQPKADAITLLLVITCFALGSVLAMGVQIIRRQEQQHEQQYERQARVIADSEIRYRLLAENATDLICRHQLDATFLYVSPACRPLLDYEPEQLVGQSPYAYFHPDDSPVVRLSHDKVLASTDTDVVSYRFRRQDGTYIWFETSSKVIRDPQTGTPWEIITVSRDVTERKAADDALLQTNLRLGASRDTLQRLMQQMPIGIQVFDTEGLCSDCNQTYMEIFGVKHREQVIGKFNILLHTNNDVTLINAFQWALAGEITRLDEAELDFDRADRQFSSRTGRLFLSVTFCPIYDENQQIVSVVALNQDITERKLADEALRKLADELLQQKNTLNAVLSATPDHFTIFDREGRYLYVNPPGLASVGLDIAQVQGKTWQELDFPAEVGERFEREREQVFTTGQPLTGFSQFPSVSGIRDFQYIYSPVFDSEGRVVLMVSTNRDLTDQRRAEQERFELALQREQVKMLQHLISDTSHDLKTPLATLNNSLYLLKKSISDPARRDHYAEVLQAQVTNLTKILEDMDSMSRLDGARDAFVFEPIDLNDLVRHIVTEHETLAFNKNQQLRFEAGDTIPRLPVDPTKLRRAITNLLTNALNYTQVGGQIDARVFRRESNVVIEIGDNGAGISQEELSLIFDRFYRSESSRKLYSNGSGLGLAISKKIVEAHQGTIEVESEIGAGSRFRIVLPLGQKPIATK